MFKGSSLWLPGARVHSFLIDASIPLCKYTTFYLSILFLVDSFSPSWSYYKYCCQKHSCSVLVSLCPGVLTLWKIIEQLALVSFPVSCALIKMFIAEKIGVERKNKRKKKRKIYSMAYKAQWCQTLNKPSGNLGMLTHKAILVSWFLGQETVEETYSTFLRTLLREEVSGRYGRQNY